MFDTLQLKGEAGESEFFDLSALSSRLSLVTSEGRYNHSGERFVNGHLGNLRVSATQRAYKVEGSLPRYFLGDNLQTLNRRGTAEAIEQLSDTLSLRVSGANVHKIDVAGCLLMDFQPERYLPYLGAAQHYTRLENLRSVYYRTRRKQLAFYNKIAEAKAKRLSVPQVYQGMNLLRYEMRLQRDLLKQLNLPTLTASQLFEERLYMKLLKMWESEFEGIEKRSCLKPTQQAREQMKKPKDFFDFLLATKVQEMGQEQALQMIEEMRQQEVFPNPNYYSRCKARVRELASLPAFTEEAPDVEELKRKVKQATRYYR